MPSYRNPKGVVTRPVPDWNSGNLNYGGNIEGIGGTLTNAFALLNNDALGGLLIIWDCTISIGRFTAGVAPLGTAFWFTGTVVLPNPGATGSPVVAIGSQQPGLFINNAVVDQVGAGTSSYEALAGEGVWRWDKPFPMAILNANLALFVQYTLTNAQVTFGVVYEWAPFA